MIRSYRRPVLVLAATLSIAIAAVAALAVKGPHDATAQQLIAAKLASKDLRLESQGTANGGQGGESAELLAAMQQFDNARVAIIGGPSMVLPRAGDGYYTNGRYGFRGNGANGLPV